MLGGHGWGVHAPELLEDPEPEPLFELDRLLDVDPLLDPEPLLDLDPLLDPEPLERTHRPSRHWSPSGQSRFAPHLMALGDKQSPGSVQTP